MKLITLSLCWCLSALNSLAQNAVKIINVPDANVKIGTLDNGLQYYLLKSPKESGKINIQMSVKAGTYREDSNQVGAAHLLEHMSMHSTANFPNFKQMLQTNGLRIGANMNANTGGVQTNFYFSIPVEKSFLLDSLLWIFRDIIEGKQLNENVINTERGALLNEIGKPESDSLHTGVAFTDLVPDEHFRMSINKIRNSTVNLKASDIRQFHANWYQPRMTGIFVETPIDLNIAASKISGILSTVKNSNNNREALLPDILLSKGGQYLIQQNKEDRIIISFYRFFKEQPAGTYENFKKDLTASILNAIMNYRQSSGSMPNSFFSYQKDRFGPVFGASISGTNGIIKKTSNKDSLKNIFRQLLIEEHRLSRFGISEAEFIRAKKAVIEDLSFNINIAVLENAFICETPVIYPETKNKWLAQFNREVDHKVLNHMIKSWIKTTPDIYIICDSITKSHLPTIQEISTLRKLVNKERISPVKYAFEEIAPLMESADIEQLSLAGNECRTKNIQESGVTELQLQNGITIFLKPILSNPENTSITLKGFVPVSVNVNGSISEVASNNIPDEVLRNGLGKLSHEQLEKFLHRHSVEISVVISSSGCEFSSEAKNEKGVELAAQYIYLFINKAQQDSSTAVFSNLNNAKLFIVGNFDADSLKTIMGRYLSNLKNSKQNNDLANNNRKFVRSKKYYGNEDWKYDFTFSNPTPTDIKGSLTMEVLKFILIHKLFQEIRWKKGGIYGASADYSEPVQNKSMSSFSISLSSNNFDSTTIVSEVVRIITNLQQKGPEGYLLSLGFNQAIQDWNDKNNDPRFWAELTGKSFKEDFSPIIWESFLNWPYVYKTITAEDIRIAAAKNLSLDRIFR